jgi:hypothetical protein
MPATASESRGLYAAGRLDEAVAALAAELRDDPGGREARQGAAGPDGARVPVGQKLLRVDGELVPFLEVRELQVLPPRSEEP